MGLPLEADYPLSDQSVYEELLTRSRSNGIPRSAVERSQLLALIEDNRMILEKCTDQVGRHHLEKIIKFQKSLLSPIRTLPTEIICSVLNLVLNDFHGVIRLCPYGSQRLQRRGCGFIFQLLKVCSAWREIMICNPSFWCRFALQGWIDHSSPMALCLRELLQRSGTVAPMYLDILLVDEAVSNECPILDAFVEHASRWKELRLRSIQEKPYLGLAQSLDRFSSQNTSFSSLESLIIFSRFPLEPGSFGSTFSHCPRLHTLRISSYHTADLFDLQHLTTLKISLAYFGPFATLLHKCPCLNSLEYGFVSDKNTPAGLSNTSAICHSHLKKLVVMNDCSSIGFWKHVSLPKLTCVLAELTGDQNGFDEFKKMLIDSRCILEEVHIIWPRGAPNNSTESLVQGISISPKSHAKFGDDRSWGRRCFTAAPPSLYSFPGRI